MVTTPSCIAGSQRGSMLVDRPIASIAERSRGITSGEAHN